MALPILASRPLLRAGLRRVAAFLLQRGSTVTNDDGTQDVTPAGLLRSKSVLGILGTMVAAGFTFPWEQLDWSSRQNIWSALVLLYGTFGTAIGALWWKITATIPTTGPWADGA